MPQKIPSKPPPARTHTTPRMTARPTNASPSAIPETLSRITESYKKRRSGIWAVGVPVIVIAGVYIGAQYKESVQAQERIATQQQRQTESDSSQFSTFNKAANQNDAGNDTHSSLKSGDGNGAVNNNANKQDIAQASSNIQRQISFLEDRRGVLLKQKLDVEGKLARVKEKQRREDEMESRRKIEIGSVK